MVRVMSCDDQLTFDQDCVCASYFGFSMCNKMLWGSVFFRSLLSNYLVRYFQAFVFFLFCWVDLFKLTVIKFLND